MAACRKEAYRYCLPGIYLQQAALRAVAQSASMKLLPPTVVSSTSPNPSAPEPHRPQLKLFELATMPEKSTTSAVVPTFDTNSGFTHSLPSVMIASGAAPPSTIIRDVHIKAPSNAAAQSACLANNPPSPSRSTPELPKYCGLTGGGGGGSPPPSQCWWVSSSLWGQSAFAAGAQNTTASARSRVANVARVRIVDSP